MNRRAPCHWRRDARGVSELVGNVLLIGITVGIAVSLSLAVVMIPAPLETAQVVLEGFILPPALNRTVVEHRGGTTIPLRSLSLYVTIDAIQTKYNVGDRLDAGDAAWRVVASDGTLRAGADHFRPGDQVRYTNAAIIGKEVIVAGADEARNTLVLVPTKLQDKDTTPPRHISARAITTTQVLVTFNEPLSTIAPTDFLVAPFAVTAARILGNGSVAELTVSPMPPGAAPPVESVALPAGTRDYADLLLVGGVIVTSVWSPLPAPTPNLPPTAAGAGPVFTTPAVNLIYQSVQGKDLATSIGLSIINPTATDIGVDLVRISASPTLGPDATDKFFRATLSNGPGSDPEFACTWSGADTDTVTCDPPSAFTVPVNGMRQVVLNFRTSKAPQDGYTIVTGEAVLTAPSSVLASPFNVHHQGAGVQMSLFGLSAAGGNPEAGAGPVAGGTPQDFHFRWRAVSGDAKTRTKFVIPSGWRDVSVPAQDSLGAISVIVRQPTAGSEGYVLVGQELTTASPHEFFYRATPPAGAAARVIEVDFEGSKEGGSSLSFHSLLWFGLEID